MQENINDGWGREYLSPSDAFKRYTEYMIWFNTYLKDSYSLAEYLPVVKGELEECMNRLQFILTFTNSNPYMTAEDKVILNMLITQACFWLGYTEAQKPKVEIPVAFLRALGE